MAEPFLGEIRLFSFAFAPRSWALCNGQLLSIAQNQALFALLGTTYGGNGQTTFALPDLRDRVPLHRSAAYSQGQAGGESAHALAQSEIPSHSHSWTATTNPATSGTPSGPVATTAAEDLTFRDGFDGATQQLYGPAQSLAALRGDAVGGTGQG
jgi:microcystin-dependent protein